MKLREPDSPAIPAIIESTGHHAHHFISAGTIEAAEIDLQNPAGGGIRQAAFRDQREFEGWKSHQ